MLERCDVDALVVVYDEVNASGTYWIFAMQVGRNLPALLNALDPTTRERSAIATINTNWLGKVNAIGLSGTAIYSRVESSSHFDR